MNAIVLAGGPADDVAALQDGAQNKAFVRVGGRELVARVIDALRDCARIERIVAVAPSDASAHPALVRADEIRQDGKRIRDSLASGLAGFEPDDMVLVCASDLPVLTPQAIDDFIARALEADADVGYGCLEKRTHLAAYPEVPHTWARLLDGTFCGGGLIAIKPRALGRLNDFIEQLGAARKNPLRLASLFGWDMLVRFAMGRLSIANAERRASELLRAPARAIVSRFAETAVNVDRPSDVAIAEGLVTDRPTANV